MRDQTKSVAFDQVADIYDTTRSLSDEAKAKFHELLGAELRDRDPVLEIGVGTGRIALPVHGAGMRLVGVDLSMPMLAKLVEKGGGAAPFPVVQTDATKLPFLDDRFGAAYGVHVLHLIPAWREAVAELVRVVRPGGVVLIDLGGLSPEHDELDDRVKAELGTGARHPGLTGDDATDQLDAAFAEHGLPVRELEPVIERWAIPPGDFLKMLEGGVFSWTWPIAPEERRRAAEAVKPWAEGRYGSLEEPYPFERRIIWRAYDRLG